MAGCVGLAGLNCFGGGGGSRSGRNSGNGDVPVEEVSQSKVFRSSSKSGRQQFDLTAALVGVCTNRGKQSSSHH